MNKVIEQGEVCEGGCPSNCLMRFELSTIIPHQVHSPYLNWLECHTIGLSRTLFPPSAAHTSYICLSSLSLAGKVSASSFFLSLLAPPCCNGECDETLISTFFFSRQSMCLGLFILASAGKHTAVSGG